MSDLFVLRPNGQLYYFSGRKQGFFGYCGFICEIKYKNFMQEITTLKDQKYNLFVL